ncbi:hypothetical protein DAEQUDRAFT_729765 [Daedalea quercina L-15889]|uniref:Alpha/beta hydrolase fold-3 domain-containing protein n=1 Tax=Daedalea quercina L-15889 TaxID=1314783 RepID=A0A165NH03_9APHY|nr:hypothetical protein DAEQUDRAFT_729765 [Daedalea quercina L-15889]
MVSPTADWTHPRELSPGSAVFRHWRSDFVHPIFESGYPIRALAGRLPPETVTASVYLSPGARAFEPAAGMLADMPRTCIVTRGAEQLVDSMWRLRDRLRADNGEERVSHVSERDATHDVLVSSWQEPERTNVLKKIAAWTEEIAGQA